MSTESLHGTSVFGRGAVGILAETVVRFWLQPLDGWIDRVGTGDVLMCALGVWVGW
jgi:hypothetical protein